ncbi:hypothetical protein SYNPS1DRAFT_27560 [Syncephalis pseudoplumigaleata]|uniref:BZIP domain-containing protein n=1 Tax=Syncephalis pseudoplumigaleata TaxID=1712513 RepID=A0A4P9Z2J8_9FUNG|nr:hypothetical protein SYNPS1DRAFT_28372 [Syncephalis pseudoplumigaleata]RKP26757.1 hypothetical protein SYNPS1DRAFT_27560 [Syncephalis pseudoplumigaleata]|eukprot:RKP25916.1 hypothetical protein SYNPS1DRAFT_28372 [Syncephalis pseudoplumigaleata]
MSSSLDSRIISSPLAALSMVATSSLEGRDLYFLGHETGHATASAPASHAGSAPPSPSTGPAYMDDLGYHHHQHQHQHRKRKCLAAGDDHAPVPERTWSPKARSPLGHHAVSSSGERLPPMSAWASAEHQHQQHQHRGQPATASRDENPYPSPRLPAILPATAAPHSSSPPSGASPNGLASLLNPAHTVADGRSTPTQQHPAAASAAASSPSNAPIYAPAATRRHHYDNAMVAHGPGGNERTASAPRASTSPVPSSSGRGSPLYGNESPLHPSSVDGGSRPATPTSTGTLHMTPEERRRRRLERNRLAARECRQKKKVYVQELEDRMERMESENRRLRKEIEELNAKLTLGSMHLDRRGMFDEQHPHPHPTASAASSSSGLPLPPMEHGAAAATPDHHHHHHHHPAPTASPGSGSSSASASASPSSVMVMRGGGGGAIDREHSVPTPPPSHGSYMHGNSNGTMPPPPPPPPRDLSISPTLPKPMLPLTHGRPHADSWSSV